MRELVVEGQEVVIIPQNFRFINRGKVSSVSAGEFVLDLDYVSDGIMKNNFCEFYTQTPHGKLYFDSYAKEVEDKKLVIASPSKHKFLQRRQYKRVKFLNDLVLKLEDKFYDISTLDISAGGLKFRSSEKIDIDKTYSVSIPLENSKYLDCRFLPIRIEKKEDFYTISGQFEYDSSQDKMLLVQFCEKRSIEIENK